jgi:hypothetical protein
MKSQAKPSNFWWRLQYSHDLAASKCKAQVAASDRFCIMRRFGRFLIAFALGVKVERCSKDARSLNWDSMRDLEARVLLPVIFCVDRQDNGNNAMFR